MKKLFFMFLMFISIQSFSQTKFLLPLTDTLLTIDNNRQNEVIGVNLYDTSTAKVDTVVFEVYLPSFQKWVGARMYNVQTATYSAYDSTFRLTSQIPVQLRLAEDYAYKFRVRFKNRVTGNLGVEAYTIRRY